MAITHAILRKQRTVTMHSFAKLESLVVSNMPTLNPMNERQIDRFYRILSYFQGRSIILAMDYYYGILRGTFVRSRASIHPETNIVRTYTGKSHELL